jgi:hypothetical protein
MRRDGAEFAELDELGAQLAKRCPVVVDVAEEPALERPPQPMLQRPERPGGQGHSHSRSRQVDGNRSIPPG